MRNPVFFDWYVRIMNIIRQQEEKVFVLRQNN